MGSGEFNVCREAEDRYGNKMVISNLSTSKNINITCSFDFYDNNDTIYVSSHNISVS